MESLTRAGLTALVAGLMLATPIAGTFALVGGTQAATAQMNVTRAKGQTRLDITEMKAGSQAIVMAYDLDMTKLMHLIVISDDFSQFLHVHPAFNAKNGHFQIVVPLSNTRRYYAFADTHPKGMSQQVFRFPIAPGSLGAASGNPTPAFTPSPLTASTGKYTVKLGSTQFRANATAAVPVTIEHAGKLASDLQPYLGAAAHAVFIDTSTLSYVHVHPMAKGAMDADMGDMSGMKGMPAASTGAAEMTMNVPALPIGTYKLWLQFRGGDALYTAPFTIVVR